MFSDRGFIGEKTGLPSLTNRTLPNLRRKGLISEPNKILTKEDILSILDAPICDQSYIFISPCINS